MKVKNLVIASLATMVALALFPAAAQAAVAAEVPAATIAGPPCPVPNAPYKSGTFSVGHGYSRGCGVGAVRVTLQRHRAWGWTTAANGDFAAPGERTVYFNCNGTGTYTYRTVVSWSGSDGFTKTRTSSEVRFSC